MAADIGAGTFGKSVVGAAFRVLDRIAQGREDKLLALQLGAVECGIGKGVSVRALELLAHVPDVGSQAHADLAHFVRVRSLEWAADSAAHQDAESWGDPLTIPDDALSVLREEYGDEVQRYFDAAEELEREGLWPEGMWLDAYERNLARAASEEATTEVAA